MGASDFGDNRPERKKADERNESEGKEGNKRFAYMLGGNP